MPGNRKALPREISARSSRNPLALAALLTALSMGCASPGPPRPPSLNLPKPVTDLSAVRVGNQVRLSWTTPTKNTDNLPVKLTAKGTLTAQICRTEVPSNAGNPVSRPAAPNPNPDSVFKTKSSSRRPRPATTPISVPAACVPVLRLTVQSGSGTAQDTLPSRFTTDPIALLEYRVEIFNTAGHSAGASNPAYAAGGAAPGPIEELQATTIASGAMLEWDRQTSSPSTTVELTRINTTLLAAQSAKSQSPSPSSQPPHAARRPATRRQEKSATPLQPAGQESPETHLRVPPAGPAQSTDSLAGTIDITARFGPTYRYTAQLVRAVQINGHSLEIRSLDSNPISLTLRDTFPPAIPTGLAAIPGQAASETSIDLSWQSNSEPDLAGYLVYRRELSSSNLATAPARLTPVPLPGPAFRDLTAIPGQRYGYTVTAIDISGNESPPTPEIQETLPQP